MGTDLVLLCFPDENIMSGNPNWIEGGPSPNPNGRPKGSKNRKTLLREELEKDGSALAAAIKAKALDGDTSAQALWLARLEPVIRPRAEPVEFDLDTKLSAAGQIEQVIKAVAEGALTIDEGQLICNMIRQRAEVIALEGASDGAAQVVDALRAFAQGVEQRTQAPYVCDTPVREAVVTTAPPAEAPKAPGTPRMIRKADGSLVPSANWPKPEPALVPKPWERAPN